MDISVEDYTEMIWEEFKNVYLVIDILAIELYVHFYDGRSKYYWCSLF